MNSQYNPGDIVLQNWKLTRLIGEGNHSSVFEAERVDSRRVYKAAIKIITITRSSSEIKDAAADDTDQVNRAEDFKGIVEELTDVLCLMSSLE
jgi:hypothetical protein